MPRYKEPFIQTNARAAKSDADHRVTGTILAPKVTSCLSDGDIPSTQLYMGYLQTSSQSWPNTLICETEPSKI